MSKYEQYKELTEVISKAQSFIKKLSTADNDCVSIRVANFMITELNEQAEEQHKPPAFLVRTISQMIKANCLDLAQVALSTLEQDLIQISSEAKREAQAILDEIGSHDSKALQPKAQYVGKTATEKKPSKKVSKTVEKIAPGTKFNHFEVIRFAPEKTKNKQVYECKCVCGTIKFIDKYTLPNRYSCGCISKNEKILEPVKINERLIKPKISVGNISPAKSPRERIEAIREQKALEAELGDIYD